MRLLVLVLEIVNYVLMIDVMKEVMPVMNWLAHFNKYLRVHN